jgi:hypothetical protein
MNLYRKSSGNLCLSNEDNVNDLMIAYFDSPDQAVEYFKKLRVEYPYSQVIKSTQYKGRKHIYFSWHELTDYSTLKRYFKK